MMSHLFQEDLLIHYLKVFCTENKNLQLKSTKSKTKVTRNISIKANIKVFRKLARKLANPMSRQLK